MSRRDLRPTGPYPPPPPPSKCAKVLYYTWRLCSVVFQHLVMISLVVAYCILGAVTFERLEAQHEREVKQNISFIRLNTTHSIWSMTNATPVLAQANWTRDVTDMLKDFENAILLEMKVRGWDGNESTDHIQWTFTGALFYSIIVITTIGYGHIAPKTQTGKVVTILYAILGIPLMLLCLSNIGDVMASSFRFLYWRVCCYVCTRPPKRRHHHHHPSIRRSVRGSRRRRLPPLQRAHSDTDCRYRDSGYGSGRVRRVRPSRPRPRSQPPHVTRPTDSWDIGPRDVAPDRSPGRFGSDREYRDIVEDEFSKGYLPLHDLEVALKDLEEQQKKFCLLDSRSKSLPRPAKTPADYGPRRHLVGSSGPDDDTDLFEMHDLHDVDYDNYREKRERELEERQRDDRAGYRDRGNDSEDEDGFEQRRYDRRPWYGEEHRHHSHPEYCDHELEEYPSPKKYRGYRARSAIYGYGRRWEDSKGERSEDDEGGRWEDMEGGRWEDAESRRPRRLRRLRTVDESARHSVRYSPSPEREEWSDDEVLRVPARRSCPPPDWGYYGMDPAVGDMQPKEELKPVPIWLCVLLVGGYIVAGTFLFRRWEGWSALDAAYFCFITLTTIGFGDFVPAQGVRGGSAGAGAVPSAVHSLALCALYVLLGIALLAMAFNLVQEEVRANVASVATKLGIIKPKLHERDCRDY